MVEIFEKEPVGKAFGAKLFNVYGRRGTFGKMRNYHEKPLSQAMASLATIGTIERHRKDGINPHTKRVVTHKRMRKFYKVSIKPKTDRDGYHSFKAKMIFDTKSKYALFNFSYYPYKKEFRDPAIWKAYGYGPTPDRIHIGSSWYFKRYAVTSVNIFGKDYPAGRQGTTYQGLGFEPLKTPKSAQPRKAYRVFIPKPYPKAAFSDGVRLTTRGGAASPLVELYFASKYARSVKKSVSGDIAKLGVEARRFLKQKFYDIHIL